MYIIFEICHSANIYLFKVNNRSTRKGWEVCSELTMETSERCHWRRSGVFSVNFEHISHPFLVFILLAMNKYMLVGYVFYILNQDWVCFLYSFKVFISFVLGYNLLISANYCPRRDCSLLDMQNLLLFPRNPFHASHQGVLGGPGNWKGSQRSRGFRGSWRPGTGSYFSTMPFKSILGVCEKSHDLN